MSSQRGVVLVQVMVLSMVLGSIAAMLVQWQYGRYVTTYRVENFARGRTILMAAYNKKLSDMIPIGSSANWNTNVTVTDPVFGTCTVYFNNAAKCSTSFDPSPGSNVPVCAGFDPCTDCTGSPCS